ncbi:thymidine kinase [Candidatus Mycoplasma mahonii]|uniref:thymidine kinase n=1 Tax=Candidatus Mycoplasma mahonii TaxID=3004105 RepID=UPI0026ECB7F0|nr:thymidine kinase [Candidatus Mycoplasma mahonii]WKX02409.1 thymidine kinase [Candidatus Mycoplasma mahonii]
MTFYKKYSEGLIEVIVGPMFSGKSEELIKRIKQVGYAKMKSLVFTPIIDDRWDGEKIISRAGGSVKTKKIKKAKDILKFWDPTFKVVAIDEAQFFDKGILEVITTLANNGVRVIISALDLDYTGKPFGHVPEILAMAEMVSKESAICVVCRREATQTYKKQPGGPQVQVGNEEYEARCRECHRRGTLSRT